MTFILLINVKMPTISSSRINTTSLSKNNLILYFHYFSFMGNYNLMLSWVEHKGFFLNKAIGIINFAKSFLNFIDDTMIWYLNSKLDINLSCVKGFRNLNSMVTWCINWRRLLALIFLAQFIKIISHYIKIGYNINVLQQTACLVVNPIKVGNFAFLVNCTPVGLTSDSMKVPT